MANSPLKGLSQSMRQRLELKGLQMHRLADTAHTHARTCTQKHTYVRTYTCTDMHREVHPCTDMHTYAHTCTYVRAYNEDNGNSDGATMHNLGPFFFAHGARVLQKSPKLYVNVDAACCGEAKIPETVNVSTACCGE